MENLPTVLGLTWFVTGPKPRRQLSLKVMSGVRAQGGGELGIRGVRPNAHTEAASKEIHQLSHLCAKQYMPGAGKHMCTPRSCVRTENFSARSSAWRAAARCSSRSALPPLRSSWHRRTSSLGSICEAYTEQQATQ